MLYTKQRLQPKFDDIPEGIDYFDLPYVSNSDLGKFNEETGTRDVLFDPQAAYDFGSLIDAVITEPGNIDVIKHRMGDKQFAPSEFEMVLRMRDSFFSDPECRILHRHSDFQRIMLRTVPLTYGGTVFALKMRCKWDFWLNTPWWGADLKSTVADSQGQFEAACRHFRYNRQRAVYMTIANSNQDMLIGISKKNFKIFKLRIKRGDDFFNSGMSEFNELALKYWAMYGG